MITTERGRQRRKRRLFAAVAGWALIGAVSTGIVARSNAAEVDGGSAAAAATGGASSSVASTGPLTSETSTPADPTSAAGTSGTSESAASAAETSETVTPESVTSAPSETAIPASSPAVEAAQARTYPDGSYTATGSYQSPGGDETITITLTLTGDLISAASAEGDADSGPSSQYQTKFIDNFAALIVGKNIDEVSLDKVSGSSLTSTGFNEAVETIKSDALG